MGEDGATVYIMLKETSPVCLHFLSIVCAFSNHCEETEFPYFSLRATSSTIPQVRGSNFWKVILKLFLTQSTELYSSQSFQCHSKD